MCEIILNVFQSLNLVLIKFTEFTEWKEKIEQETCTNWYIYSTQSDTTYYRCHRNGKLTVETDATERGREFNGIPTVKTNTDSASHLVVVRRNNKIHIKYCTDHTSHLPQKELLHVSKSAKN